MSIIPTISSGTAGPLGVQHLPRLWQKASLDAVGKLHPDYPAAGAGFDQMTLDALGIERQAFLDYVGAEKPSYIACEAWCQANGNFDSDKIAAHNAAVNGYNHDDATRAEDSRRGRQAGRRHHPRRRQSQQPRRLGWIPLRRDRRITPVA